MIAVVLPRDGQLVWHRLVIDRLRAAGHTVGVEVGPHVPLLSKLATLTLLAEQRVLRRASRLVEPAASLPADPPRHDVDHCLDLTGKGPPRPGALTLSFNGSPSLATLADSLSRGVQPEVALVRGGAQLVERARPMVDRPVLLGPSLDDVLAATATLAVIGIRRLDAGAADLPSSTAEAESRGPGSPYLVRLGRDVLRRARFRHAHWRVGFRFTDGAGVAGTGTLGTGWNVLGDDGSRFYADPFPFAHEGRFHIFVEDYLHSARKAAISVVEVPPEGPLGTPQPVLEEPFHLSYPQVFERDGEIWMLPEGSERGALTLYRSVSYPDRWERAATLVEGRALSDATLLEHKGSLWLFATERFGQGSTSDTMVVLRSDSLLGPWRDHPASPLFVDRTRARPGGAFVRDGNRILLPVQDGSLGYGGGLGLSELARLDEDTVDLLPPIPVKPDGGWPYPKIHTLNRAGPLEVIDGIVAVRRSGRGQ